MKNNSNYVTTLYVLGILKAMSLFFRVSPAYRRNILDGKKGLYEFAFNARLQFRTRDDSVSVYSIFEDGKMKVGWGKIEKPDLTMTFRTASCLKELFAIGKKNDVLIMMLNNDLTMDGNLMYLAKFGFLTAELTEGRKKRAILSGNSANGEIFKGILSNPLFNGANNLLGRNIKGYLDQEKSFEDYSSSTTRCNVGGEVTRKPNASLRHATLTSSPHDKVEFLEEPFLRKYNLDDFPRLLRGKERLFSVPNEVCVERAALLTKYFVESGFEFDSSGNKRDPGIRQAEALRYILKNRKPIIGEDDLIAGTTTTKDVGVLLFPEFGALALWPELLTVDEREMNPYKINLSEIDTLNFEVFPFWTERNIMEYTRSKYGNPVCQQLEGRWVLYFCWKPHAISHTIPDFPAILERGLGDIIWEAKELEKKAKTEEERNFYRSLQIAQQGVLDYAANLSKKAKKDAKLLRESLTGKDDDIKKQRIKELEDMAEICARVPEKPARTLHEAINCIWICWVALHMENMNAGLSIGRLDHWLQPFFIRDMEKAKSKKKREETIKRAIELVGSFYLKCSDHLPNVPDIGNRLFGGSSSDQAVTLGGVDKEGESAVCDMTYIFLKVTEMLSLREPNVNARFYPGVNSYEYLKRLIEVNTITTATPSLHNDRAVIDSMINQGFSPEDARDWAATGCVEPTSCGRHMGHTNCMLLNTVAPLEMAMNCGVHPVVGEQIGLLTDSPAHKDSFPTFDDFKEVYKKQLKYMIDQSVEYNNLLGVVHQELHPTPLLSSFFQGPMEKGKDVVNGGALYNSSGAALVSISDVIDSLFSIKKLIYDDKSVTWNEMLKAVEEDFSGHEALYMRIMNKVPKFGTDAKGPLELGQELIDFIYDAYQGQNNYRGGKYTSGFWSMSNHVAFGTLSGALPSGRKKGKPFTPGITPSPGVTGDLLQSIRTIASIDPLKIPNNIAFNVKIAPGIQDNHEDFVERVSVYTKTYFELGGMQMQFNMVTSDTLREAMKNPDEYRWLLVRISGYNAYFVELNRDTQEEIIERTEFGFS